MPEKCIKCESTEVRRASSRLRHWGRLLARSRKRYCAACGEKWHVETAAIGDLLRREDILIVACVIAVPILIAVATHPYFLRDWFKTQVRSYYDRKYGAQSQAHLWHDLGGFYGGHNAATNDYGLHHKK